jgi:hypothetical protein
VIVCMEVVEMVDYGRYHKTTGKTVAVADQ